MANSALELLNKTGQWANQPTIMDLINQSFGGSTQALTNILPKFPTPAAPKSTAATDYAKNPFTQTVPTYAAPPSLPSQPGTPMNFGFGDFVNQLGNGSTLPGMSGVFPNGYKPQSQQQVQPYAFLGMQGNPFAGQFQSIANGGLPMTQGLLGSQAPQPQAMPQAAPQQAMAAPQQQAMAQPASGQLMPPEHLQRHGGYGWQQQQRPGGYWWQNRANTRDARFAGMRNMQNQGGFDPNMLMQLLSGMQGGNQGMRWMDPNRPQAMMGSRRQPTLPS